MPGVAEFGIGLIVTNDRKFRNKGRKSGQEMMSGAEYVKSRK